MTVIFLESDKERCCITVGKAAVAEPGLESPRQEVSTPSLHSLWASVSQMKAQTQTLRDTQQDLEDLECVGIIHKGGSRGSNLGLWPKWKVASSVDKSCLQEATLRFWYHGLGEARSLIFKDILGSSDASSSKSGDHGPLAGHLWEAGASHRQRLAPQDHIHSWTHKAVVGHAGKTSLGTQNPFIYVLEVEVSE